MLSKRLNYLLLLAFSLCLTSVSTFADTKELSTEKINFEHNLNVSQFHVNPIDQFIKLFTKNQKNAVPFLTTCILSTVKPDGKPNARGINIIGVHKDGFIFATNLNSNKANEIISNPNAALTFLWLNQNTKEYYQVQISGLITPYNSSFQHELQVNNKKQILHRQLFILKPNHMKFSQIHFSNKAGAVEYITYNLKNNKWTMKKEDDYYGAGRGAPIKGLKMSF